MPAQEMFRVRPRRVRRVPLIATLAAVALVAVACDDDAGDTTASTTTAAAEVATTAAATGDTAAAPATPTGDPQLTLGFLTPGAGLLSAVVVGQQRGLDVAVSEINAAGGVLGGPLATVTAAESPDVDLATTVDGLAKQGANVLVGPVGSDTAAALLPILAERGLLTCSASATATSLTAAPTAPATFVRTALRDDHFAAFVADQVMAATDDTPAPATVMVIGRDDLYGSELSAGLAADLTARGAAVTTIDYPSRRVQFPDESAAVAATQPDRVILAAYEEGPRLVSDIVGAGYPVDRIVGLDGMLVPRLADQAFSGAPDKANGLTVYGTTGDRALMNRLQQASAPQDQVSYGAQMYDCVVTLALATIAAGSADPAAVAAQVGPVTAGGRTCSTFAHCVELLAAGEDIDYDGATGHLAIDAAGDVSSARITTARVIDGALQPIAAQDVDLVQQRQDAVFANAVFVAQLQQALKALGYYEGEVTGVYDDATTAAVGALQHDLGLPETGQYDAATDAALRARVGGRLSAFGTGVAGLQQALADRGFYDGPIDGQYSAATIAAVKAFQTSLGVPATGIIDVATLQAIYASGVATGVGSVTTTTEKPTPTTKPPEATTTTKPTTPPVTTAKPTPETKPPPTKPPVTEAPSTTEAPAPPAADDLYDTISADPRFSTLIAIARTAGYGGDLSQPGPLTVFAPTNDAFAAMNPEERKKLDEHDAAVAFLGGLVAEGLFTSAELAGMSGVKVFSGATVPVTASGSTITFGGAPISGADVTASNGVLHALSAVPTQG